MGGAGGAARVRHAGAEGVRDRQDASRSRHPQVRRRPHRLGREPWRLGEGPGRQHANDRGHLPAGRGCGRELRRAARRRRRNLLGRHAQLEADGGTARDGGAAEDRWFPGRHGAHASLHDGLQRARGSDSPRRPRLVEPIGARRGVEDRDPHAAAVDDRLPRRAERCDGQGLGLARQDRAPLPARPIPMGSSTSPRTPVSGCATNRANRRARCSTSAGTGACSRTP